MTGIYIIKNIENNKVYIGQSRNISHRKACHFFDLKNGCHHNRKMQEDFDKNPKAFIFKVICSCKKEFLNDLEDFYICKYKSSNDSFGYNIDLKSHGKGMHSEETLKRMSLSKIGNQVMRGVRLSSEWKKHLSQAQPHRRKIICIETGEVYESFADASRKTGLQRTKIVSVCTGHRKSTGGFHFKYADKNTGN